MLFSYSHTELFSDKTIHVDCKPFGWVSVTVSLAASLFNAVLTYYQKHVIIHYYWAK